jgi:hypothetical protein
MSKKQASIVVVSRKSAKSQDKTSKSDANNVVVVQDANKTSNVVVQTQAKNRLQRITMFGQSLTSVVKAIRLHDKTNDLSSQDVSLVCERLASSSQFAKATITTAMSDALNDKYRRTVANLSNEQVATILKTLSDAKKQASKTSDAK